MQAKCLQAEQTLYMAQSMILKIVAQSMILKYNTFCTPVANVLSCSLLLMQPSITSPFPAHSVHLFDQTL